MKKLTLSIGCGLLVLLSTTHLTAKGDSDVTLTEFEWSASPSDIRDESDRSVSTDHYGSYKKLSHSATIRSENWNRFFVFHDGTLIAQGLERSEQLDKPRVGTISDVVSYDNEYWLRDALTETHGSPAFVDDRSKRDYSRELGDAALRAKRAVEWDLLGERYRWEIDDGTIRYSVQYSRDGTQLHRAVNVNPGKWSHYFEFRAAQAFRSAGIRRVRHFRKRAQTWVVNNFGKSGTHTVQFSSHVSTEPKAPKRTSRTYSNCRVEGKSCQIHFKYYGGILYEVDIDISRTGKLPRRAHFDKIGRRVYKRYQTTDQKLRGGLGKPAAERVAGDLDNGRNMQRVENLVQGQEAFWSVWYDVGNDVLVRHDITGEQTGAEFRIDHHVRFYFHDVARALAERDAWKRETKTIAK